MRSAWLHFLGDGLASLSVLVGGIIIYFTNLYWIDTLLSAILGITILYGAFSMLKDIAIILLEGIPNDLSITAISESLTQIPNIKATRDIHVWYLSEENAALSAHIQLNTDINISQTEPILKEIKNILIKSFNINHVNIQFETKECNDCYHSNLDI